MSIPNGANTVVEISWSLAETAGINTCKRSHELVTGRHKMPRGAIISVSKYKAKGHSLGVSIDGMPTVSIFNKMMRPFIELL